MDDQEKPGIKTTEFWTKNAVQIIVMAGALTHHGVDEKTAVAVVGALEGLYLASRVFLKAVRAAADALAWLRPIPPTKPAA